MAVAGDLGCLALAVEQAGAFIRKTNWTYSRYRAMVAVEPLRLYSQDIAGLDKTVALVWQHSVDHVTACDDDPCRILNALRLLESGAGGKLLESSTSSRSSFTA